MTDRKQWKTGLSIGSVTEEKLERAACCGIEVVEVSGVESEEDWKKIPQWERNTGVEVRSLHLPFSGGPAMNLMNPETAVWKNLKDLYFRYIEHCAEAEIPILVSHPSNSYPYWECPRVNMLGFSIDHFSILTQKAKECGRVIALENMPQHVCHSSDDVKRFLREVPDLMFCLDVNHVVWCSYEDIIAATVGRTVTTHISDFDFVYEKHWFPMQGQINWRKLQTLLEVADYDGPFVYETMPLGYTWEDVRPNHDFLKNL